VRPVDAIREDPPYLKGSFNKIDSRRRPLTTWAFVINITDEFILELNVMDAQDESVDFGSHLLGQGDEEVTS
jgi:hypothetical protein